MKNLKDETKKRDGVFEKVRGSGVYWIQYRDAKGKRRREKVGPKQKALKLVEQRRTEARLRIKMPEDFRARAVNFSQLAQRALIHSRATKKSYRHDELRMKVLVAAFGNRAAEEITPDEIQGWLDSKSDEWTHATRNRYLALLKLAYKLAERGRMIEMNPARLVRQRKENNGRVRWLQDDIGNGKSEEDMLRAVIREKYTEHLPELEIALHTGMRQSEQFGLTSGNVDLGAGIITIGDPKNGEGRFVHLNSRALAVMRMLYEQSLCEGRVFVLNRVPRWFEDAVKEAKLQSPKFTWHCLRHTWATRLIRNGVDVKTVQELGGWKSISMVMRYAHVDSRRVMPAFETLCATNSATEAKEAEKPTAHAVQ